MLLILLAGFVYVFKNQLSKTFEWLSRQYLPCQKPIIYSIGDFDARFSMSQENFLAAIKQAEQIWEAPVGKELFAYNQKNAGLIINLIYDFCQESTIELQKLGVTISDDKNSYEILKIKYNSLQALYGQQKAALDILNKNYQTQKSAYEAEVAYWNSRGGASPAEYKKLNQKAKDIDAQMALINQAQNNLNELISSINAVVNVLNKLAGELNLGVSRYNNIGAQRGGEFKEGQYISNASGEEIDIYQFDNKDKLIRVLAHELGHALGLEHSDNPKSIMYRLNEGSNEMLAPDDVASIKNLCGVN